MKTKKCVAMVLAGGRGERLGALTRHYSKPALSFGGSRRIIDFTLSNCKNSKIDTVGVLSQYFNIDLNRYINSIDYGKPGRTGDFGVCLLPSKNHNSLYKGTADAVCRNIPFIEWVEPEHVLILSSDHIYRMDYSKLIAFHEEKGAEATVASIPVSTEEASRFGILKTDADGRVLAFEEKPLCPEGNLASMGVYVFNWAYLKQHLIADCRQRQSTHDFGADILPGMIADDQCYTYQFDGYWRDVGTVDKLWEANMDQLNDPRLQIPAKKWRVYGEYRVNNSDRITDNAVVSQSILSGDCFIDGNVQHSVLGSSVTVEHGAEILNSVIMPDVYIGSNVKIVNAIVGNHTVIRDGAVIGEDYGMDFFVDRRVCAGDVSMVSPWTVISGDMIVKKNSHIIQEKLDFYYAMKGSTPLYFGATEYCNAGRG